MWKYYILLHVIYIKSVLFSQIKADLYTVIINKTISVSSWFCWYKETVEVIATHSRTHSHTRACAYTHTHISSNIANLTASWYFIKIKYSEPNISAAASVSPLAFAVLLLAVIKQCCIAAGAPFWIGGELPVFVVRHHASNRDACTVMVRDEYMYRATPNIYIYIYIYIYMYVYKQNSCDIIHVSVYPNVKHITYKQEPTKTKIVINCLFAEQAVFTSEHLRSGPFIRIRLFLLPNIPSLHWTTGIKPHVTEL